MLGFKPDTVFSLNPVMILILQSREDINIQRLVKIET